MDNFFERQEDDSKNCSVHSLNNALGFAAVTPEVVAASIDRRLETFARLMGMPLDDPKLSFYRDRMTTDDTFFSADAVWRAAEEAGIILKPQMVWGYGGDYSNIRPDMLFMRLVFLGIGQDGAYHAVGARNGYIYDSLSKVDTPIPLTDENLKGIYKKIFAAFVISEPAPTFDELRFNDFYLS